MQARGKKARLFSAAAKLFLEKGYQATSIADLAAEVGMLKGSLYYYIQSKDDLLCQVIMDTVECAEASLLQGADTGEDAITICERITGHFAYLTQNHIGLALLLREAEQLPRARRQVIKVRIEQYERILAATLQAGQCCGVVADGDPSAIAKIMVAASTWVSWGSQDPKREALLNEGVLRLILCPVADDAERVAFPGSKSIAIAGRVAAHFEPASGLSS